MLALVCYCTVADALQYEPDLVTATALSAGNFSYRCPGSKWTTIIPFLLFNLLKFICDADAGTW
jgi:hypothetical protein